MNVQVRYPYHIREPVLSDFTDLELGLEIVVVSARSPFNMVIHRADKIFELEKIEHEIKLMYLDLGNRYPEKPYPLALHSRCCYSLYSQKKHRWVRARATESVGSENMHLNTCFELVDYACTEFLPANHARHLPDRLCRRLPQMGYRARLDEAPPDPWKDRLNDCTRFRDLVLNAELYCILMYQDPNETYCVELFDVQYQSDDEGDVPRDCKVDNQIRALPDSAYPRSVAAAPVVNRRNQNADFLNVD